MPVAVVVGVVVVSPVGAGLPPAREAAAEEEAEEALSSAGRGRDGGFIWMIFRERVGGGGRANSSLTAVVKRAADGLDRVRARFALAFALALPARGGDMGASTMAGGGRVKEGSRGDEARSSLPGRSVEETGVGGNVGRGISSVSFSLPLSLSRRLFVVSSSRRRR